MSLPRRDAHPEALGRGRQALRGDRRRRRLRDVRARRADVAIVAQINSSLVHARAPRRPRHVPRRRHARLRGGGPAPTAGSSRARRRRSPCGIPTSRRRSTSSTPGRRCPTNATYDNAFKVAVGAVPPPRRRRTRLSVEPARRREGRAARRARLQSWRERRWVDVPPLRSLTRWPTHPTLPARRTARSRPTRCAQPRAWPAAAGAPAFEPRRLLAAAHVVADPLAAVDPWLAAAIDWDATLAYRRHLWSLGFGVAEAMDTAQRGMGLDWPTSLELIRRSARRGARHAGRGRRSAARAPTTSRRTPRDDDRRRDRRLRRADARRSKRSAAASS